MSRSLAPSVEEPAFTPETSKSQTDAPLSHTDSSRRGRGLARDDEVLRMRSGEYLDVDLINGQPVGPHATQFTSMLGIITRLHVPIWETKFGKLSREVKDAILRDMEILFRFSRSAKSDRQLIRHAGEQYRRYRYNLRNKYFKDRPFDEAVANVPPTVDKTQWKRMCEMWCTAILTEIAIGNNSNREMLTMTYRKGQTSMQQIKHDYVFQLTCCRIQEDGTELWLDDESRRRHDAMTQLMTPSTESDVTQQPLTTDKAFIQVMGVDIPGHIKGARRGETLRSWYGNFGEGTSSEQEIQQLCDEVNRLQDIFDQQQQTMAQQRETIAAMVAKEVAAQLKALQGQFGFSTTPGTEYEFDDWNNDNEDKDKDEDE